MSNPIKHVLNTLAPAGNGLKQTGSGWSARCPAHEDRQASLSIAEGEDGRVLLRCHAGCDHKKIVAALGLQERDLFPRRSTEKRAVPRRAPVAPQGEHAETYRRMRDVMEPSEAAPKRSASKAYATAGEAQKAYERTLGKPTRWWTYRDPETLDEVGRVIRWDRPDGKKDIRPISRHADGWRLEHMAEPRPIFHVEFLEDADRAYVVEGEKCCDAMSLEGGLGLSSTTSSGGSSAAGKTDWSPLAGREVVILPDADDAGRRYATDVAAILHELDPPATVRVVELDGLEPGGDVADLVKGCSNADELKALREKIERLADETEPLQPKADTAITTPATPKATSTSSPVEKYRPFPTDALPEPLASFAAETASAIGCDPAYVGLPLLTVAGAAIGTTRRLELKHNYAAPPILWSVIVGESGTSKSPALRSVLEHVRGRERRLREEHAVERRDYEHAVEAYEKERSAWRGDKKAVTDPPERPAEPISQRALVSDVTVEALAAKLADNRRGLLLARDELAGFFNGLDRYANKSGGGGSDESFYLSCYNAESHAVDRRTGDRREIYVAQAALWITGTIQPTILARALGRQRIESGLLARLLLVAPPPRPAKWSEAEVSVFVRQSSHDVLDRLYELEPDNDNEGRPESRIVRLNADAKRAYVAWHDRHAEEAIELPTEDLKAAASKLRETAARVALVFHEVRLADGDTVEAGYVDAETMDRAIRFVEWQKHELRRVYSLLSESEIDRAIRQADDRLTAFVVSQGGTVATRDVIAGIRSVPDADAAEKALQRLVDVGRGDWIDKPPTERGGRPARLFVLKPEVVSAQPPKLPVKPSCADADTCRQAEPEDVAGEEWLEV